MLRRARRRSGLSLRGLAARADTSHSTLSAYEAGRKVPTVETFDRIVRAAGYDLEIGLTPRVGGGDQTARGRELVEVLELAAQFPARHTATLEFPRFPPRSPRPREQPRRQDPRDPSRARRRRSPPRVRWRARARVVHRAGARHDRHRPQRVRRRSRAAEVLAALPDGVAWSAADLAVVERDGQTRLWWDTTPVDLFVNTSEFHEQVAERCRREPFAGVDVPFLACVDLAVFKAFFSRTKDWADLEEMVGAGTLDVDRVVGVLTRYLGPTDERIDRLRHLG